MTRILTIDDLRDAIREAGEMAAELAACSREDDDAQALPSSRTGRTPVLECVQASLAAHAQLLDGTIGRAPGRAILPEEMAGTYHGSWDDEGRLVRVQRDQGGNEAPLGPRPTSQGSTPSPSSGGRSARGPWNSPWPSWSTRPGTRPVPTSGEKNSRSEVIARLPHEWSITRGQVWSWRRDHPPRSVPPLWRPEG